LPLWEDPKVIPLRGGGQHIIIFDTALVEKTEPLLFKTHPAF
jgi:hypothetical protein